MKKDTRNLLIIGAAGLGAYFFVVKPALDKASNPAQLGEDLGGAVASGAGGFLSGIIDAATAPLTSAFGAVVSAVNPQAFPSLSDINTGFLTGVLGLPTPAQQAANSSAAPMKTIAYGSSNPIPVRTASTPASFTSAGITTPNYFNLPASIQTSTLKANAPTTPATIVNKAGTTIPNYFNLPASVVSSTPKVSVPVSSSGGGVKGQVLVTAYNPSTGGKMLVPSTYSLPSGYRF